MRCLRQNTQEIVTIGPFVSNSDGVTPVTSITSFTAELVKDNSTTAVDISANTLAAIGTHGLFALTLTAAQVNTVGNLYITYSKAASFYPVKHEFQVIPSAVWDALFGGTLDLNVNVDEINLNPASGFLNGVNLLRADAIKMNGVNTSGLLADSNTALNADVQYLQGSSGAAANLAASGKGIITGTVGTGSTLTVIETGLTSAVNTFYNGRTIVFITGVLAGQAQTIQSYNGVTKEITVLGVTTAPANGDTFVIV